MTQIYANAASILAGNSERSIRELVINALDDDNGVLSFLGKKFLQFDRRLVKTYVCGEDVPAGGFSVHSKILSDTVRSFVFSVNVVGSTISVCNIIALMLRDVSDHFYNEEEFMRYFLEEAGMNFTNFELELRYEFIKSPVHPRAGMGRPVTCTPRLATLYLQDVTASQPLLKHGFMETESTTAPVDLLNWNCKDPSLPVDHGLNFQLNYLTGVDRQLITKKSLFFMQGGGTEVALLSLNNVPYLGVWMPEIVRDLVMSRYRVTEEEILIVKMAGLEAELLFDKPYDLRDTGFTLLNF